MTRLSLFPLLQATGLALLLCACTSESTDEGLPEGTTPIRFQMPETRGVVNGAGDMEAFSVWGGYDNNATNVFNGTEVRYEGNAWTYTGTQYWIAGKNYDFYAVYPTAETLTAAGCTVTCTTNGALDIQDFDVTKGHDLMTAKREDMNGSNPEQVGLSFQHELAQVKVVVKRSSQWGETNETISVNASFYGMQSKGRFQNGTWTDTSHEEETSTRFKSNVQLTSSESQKTLFTTTEIPDGSVMFIPQVLTESVKLAISYTVNGQPGDALEPIALYNHTGQWNKSTSYLYEITINPDGIIFDNLQADNWGETSYGGSITIE